MNGHSTYISELYVNPHDTVMFKKNNYFGVSIKVTVHIWLYLG